MSADLRALIEATAFKLDQVMEHQPFKDDSGWRVFAEPLLRTIRHDLTRALSAPPVDLRPWVQHKPGCRKLKHLWTKRAGAPGVYDCPQCRNWTANVGLYADEWCDKLADTCTCGLDAVLAPLSGARQDENEKEPLTRGEPMGDSTDTRTAASNEAAPETCIVAAIRMPDGYVVRGHRHCHCLSTAASIPRYQHDTRVARAEQGFVTSHGRFVGRLEGRDLQEAAGVPSASRDGYRGDDLYSEDLY